MLHTCVKKIDVTGTVENFLETKQGHCFGHRPRCHCHSSRQRCDLPYVKTILPSCMSSSPSVSVVMKASNAMHAMQSSQSDLICWVVLVLAMHVESQPDRSIRPGINSGEPRTRFLSPGQVNLDLCAGCRLACGCRHEDGFIQTVLRLLATRYRCIHFSDRDWIEAATNFFFTTVTKHVFH